MLKTKEIENLNEIANIIVNEEGCCKTPLLHGTRRYAIQTSDFDRQRFYNACKEVILFAKTLIHKNIFADDALENYQRTKNLMFLSTVVYGFGCSGAYEYGDLYLTSSFNHAFGFTYNAGGEFGEWAYRQCEGFEYFSIELDKSTKAAAEIVKEEYIKYQNSERIILVYYGVKFSDMLNRGGSPFWVDDEYMQEEIEELYNSKDTDSGETNNAFRLLNAEIYTPYVLSEKDFRAGFGIFTEISDVDEFIRDHNLYCSPKWSL